MKEDVEFRRRLADATQGFLPLSERQLDALWGHYELMLRWNRKLNLTRVVVLAEAVQVHYAESVFVASRIPDWVCSVVDVGSGAGFPGFPIAVVKPEIEVTLLESDSRKAAFLREVSDCVGNVRVMNRRAENVNGEWDCLTCRAVRVGDLDRIALRAAKCLALLVGEAGVKKLQAWQGLSELRTERLPWGEGRFLLTATVPRETV